MKLWQLGAAAVSSLVRAGDVSPVEVVTALLERSTRLDGELRAWVTLDADGALAAARRLADRLARGDALGPLAGVPIAIKDIIDVDGLPTKASSKVLADNVASADAACVERLRHADAIILGKAHTCEFAGPDPAPTRNPWDPAHTPGGSSSGSAVAVAAGMAPASLGTQTGGSTLRPAAYNGVVGLKPTYGMVSTRGVIPLAWSLDHVGVIARSVDDAAAVFAAIAGHDPLDPSSSPLADQDVHADLASATAAPVIGLMREPFAELADAATWDATVAAVERLAAHGATVREISVAGVWERVAAVTTPILWAERYAYHRDQWKAKGDLYGPLFAQRMVEGEGLDVADFVLAQRERPGLVAELEAAVRGVDIAITPAAPAPAPRDTSQTGDASFQTPWSSAGLPSIALPTGVDSAGLPTAIQLVGHRWRDGDLLSAARWCERVLAFDAHPPCWDGG